MSRKQIGIRIERLTVRGIDPRHVERIQDALTQELERCVAHGGVPAHWTRHDPVQAPRIASRSGDHPARIGQSIARSIYRGEK